MRISKRWRRSRLRCFHHLHRVTCRTIPNSSPHSRAGVCKVQKSCRGQYNLHDNWIVCEARRIRRTIFGTQFRNKALGLLQQKLVWERRMFPERYKALLQQKFVRQWRKFLATALHRRRIDAWPRADFHSFTPSKERTFMQPWVLFSCKNDSTNSYVQCLQRKSPRWENKSHK
jgi:hypothetical protein